MAGKSKKVEVDFDELDALDFDEIETEAIPQPGNSGHWRLVEQMLEQRWLKLQISDFDDYVLD